MHFPFTRFPCTCEKIKGERCPYPRNLCHKCDKFLQQELHFPTGKFKFRDTQRFTSLLWCWQCIWDDTNRLSKTWNSFLFYYFLRNWIKLARRKPRHSEWWSCLLHQPRLIDSPPKNAMPKVYMVQKARRRSNSLFDVRRRMGKHELANSKTTWAYGQQFIEKCKQSMRV